MYWSEVGGFWTDGDGKIRRANLDGSGVQDLVTGLDVPTDTSAWTWSDGKIYWTDRGERQTDGDGKIQRANLDGTGVEDVVTTGLEHARPALRWILQGVSVVAMAVRRLPFQMQTFVRSLRTVWAR